MLKRTKRFWAGLLSLTLVISFMTLTTVSAATEVIGGITYTYTVTDGEATITKAVGTDAHIDIPGELGGVPVIAIGDKAFQNRTTLETFTIPNTIKTIGASAFQGCTQLTAVDIPANVVSIGEKAFYLMRTSLRTVSIAGGAIGDQAFESGYIIESLTLGDGVTSIGNNAFRRCRGIKTVNICKNVDFIGDYAFAECQSLESILVDADNPNFADVDGVLYNKSMSTLLQYPANKAGTSYIVPNTVNTIAAGGFWGSKDANTSNILESVTLPDGLLEIKDDTFNCCVYLKNIVIPQSVTSIGRRAFSECYRMKFVHLLSPAITFGEQVFYFANQSYLCYTEHLDYADFYAKEGSGRHGSNGYPGFAFHFEVCTGHGIGLVNYYLDDSGTPFVDNGDPLQWIVTPGDTTASLLGEGGKYEDIAGKLPNPGNNSDGYAFDHWQAYVKVVAENDDGFEWVDLGKVMESTFPFTAPEGKTFYLDQLGNPEFKFVARYQKAVLVRFFNEYGSETGGIYKLDPADAAQYTWTVKLDDTVADVTSSAPKPYPGLPASNLPDTADGWTFDYWEYRPDAEAAASAAKVTPQFVFSSGTVAKEIVLESGETVWVCDIYAVYKAPTTSEEKNPYLLPLIGLGLGGAGIAGGAAIAAAGIGVGALAAGGLGLLALPLIIDLFDQDDDPAPDPAPDPDPSHSPDPTTDPDADTPYVQPPKTGDNRTAPFAAGLLGLLAAAVLVMVQRRRREDERNAFA